MIVVCRYRSGSVDQVWDVEELLQERRAEGYCKKGRVSVLRDTDRSMQRWNGGDVVVTQDGDQTPLRTVVVVDP
jgi:hypothetical protein